jgi:hypothetical protein
VRQWLPCPTWVTCACTVSKRLREKREERRGRGGRRWSVEVEREQERGGGDKRRGEHRILAGGGE